MKHIEKWGASACLVAADLDTTPPVINVAICRRQPTGIPTGAALHP